MPENSLNNLGCNAGCNKVVLDPIEIETKVCFQIILPTKSMFIQPLNYFNGSKFTYKNDYNLHISELLCFFIYLKIRYGIIFFCYSIKKVKQDLYNIKNSHQQGGGGGGGGAFQIVVHKWRCKHVIIRQTWDRVNKL